MGWNTTVVVCNDALNAIKDDPEFGASLAKACLEVVGGESVDVRSKNHVNAATVVETHHADAMVPILVGGNCGYVMPVTLHWSDHTDEALLHALAKHLGYKLYKQKRH